MNKPEIVRSMTSLGIPLFKYGVTSCILTRRQVLIALSKLKLAQIGIRGGDMYHWINNRMEPNGDGWCFERFYKESDAEFSRRTVDYSRTYITSYLNPVGKETYFSLILEVIKRV